MIETWAGSLSCYALRLRRGCDSSAAAAACSAAVSTCSDARPVTSFKEGTHPLAPLRRMGRPDDPRHRHPLRLPHRPDTSSATAQRSGLRCERGDPLWMLQLDWPPLQRDFDL